MHQLFAAKIKKYTIAYRIKLINYIYIWCTGKSATGKNNVSITFAGPLMVALLPKDIGKCATLIISLKNMESVKEKPKNYFKTTLIFCHPYILPKFHFI